MQGDPGIDRQRLEDMPIDDGVVGHARSGDGELRQILRFTGMYEIRPPRHVDRGVRQRFIHRNEGIAEAADALLVPQRLPECGAEHNRGVLDGVVTLDLHITAGGHGQVEARVSAECGEHVIEERHTGVDRDRTGAVQIEFDDDVGLFGLPFDPHAAGGGGGHDAPRGWAGWVAANRWLAVRKASFSCARPMVTRRKPGMPTSRMRTPSSR